MAVISLFTAYRCCRGDGWRRAAVRFADVIGWTVLVCWTPSLIASAVGGIAARCIAMPLAVATAIFGREPDGNSTTVSALNFLVLQWLGLRIDRRGPLIAYAPRLTPEQEAKLRARLADARAENRMFLLTPVLPEQIATGPDGWHLARWVWPLTGWWSPLRWIARRP